MLTRAGITAAAGAGVVAPSWVTLGASLGVSAPSTATGWTGSTHSSGTTPQYWAVSGAAGGLPYQAIIGLGYSGTPAGSVVFAAVNGDDSIVKGSARGYMSYADARKPFEFFAPTGMAALRATPSSDFNGTITIVQIQAIEQKVAYATPTPNPYRQWSHDASRLHLLNRMTFAGWTDPSSPEIALSVPVIHSGSEITTNTVTLTGVTTGASGGFTKSGHGFNIDDELEFTLDPNEPSTFPDPIVEGVNYWVVSDSFSTSFFRLALTQGGTPLAINGAGSGLIVVTRRGQKAVLDTFITYGAQEPVVLRAPGDVVIRNFLHDYPTAAVNDTYNAISIGNRKNLSPGNLNTDSYATARYNTYGNLLIEGGRMNMHLDTHHGNFQSSTTANAGPISIEKNPHNPTTKCVVANLSVANACDAIVDSKAFNILCKNITYLPGNSCWRALMEHETPNQFVYMYVDGFVCWDIYAGGANGYPIRQESVNCKLSVFNTFLGNNYERVSSRQMMIDRNHLQYQDGVGIGAVTICELPDGSAPDVSAILGYGVEYKLHSDSTWTDLNVGLAEGPFPAGALTQDFDLTALSGQQIDVRVKHYDGVNHTWVYSSTLTMTLGGGKATPLVNFTGVTMTGFTGTNWSTTGTAFRHATGSAVALRPSPNVAPTAAKEYLVESIVANVTAGNVRAQFLTGTTASSNTWGSIGSFQDVIVGRTGNTITQLLPNSPFDGDVTAKISPINLNGDATPG